MLIFNVCISFVMLCKMFVIVVVDFISEFVTNSI